MESEHVTKVFVEQGRYGLWFWIAVTDDGRGPHGGGFDTSEECAAQAAEMFPSADVEVVPSS